MHLRRHEVAPRGCSCTKRSHLLSCSPYSNVQNSMWRHALLYKSWTTFGSLLCRDKFCNVENAVHSGDPITRRGLVFLIRSSARRCVAGSSKSHLRPWPSQVRRSSATPAESPSASAILVTLGGENISVMSGRCRTFPIDCGGDRTIFAFSSKSSGTLASRSLSHSPLMYASWPISFQLFA